MMPAYTDRFCIRLGSSLSLAVCFGLGTESLTRPAMAEAFDPRPVLEQQSQPETARVDRVPDPTRIPETDVVITTDVTLTVFAPLPPTRLSRQRMTAAVTAQPIRATAPGGSAGGIRPLIARHADASGIPFPIADAVVRVESRYQPQARNRANLGLTQVSLATARAMGYAGGATGLFDPDTNLRYGLRYLAQAYRLAGGDTCRTVLKYQAGHRAERMTDAARAYCAKVRTHVAAMR